MIRFLMLFVALVIGLTLFINIPQVDLHLVTPYVEGITFLSGSVYGLADSSVESNHTYLRHPDFSVNIKKGCDGIVASIILISACIAFPSSWKMKIKGIIMGYLLIFLLNLVRILILFTLGVQGKMEMFHLVHAYVAQFIVIIGAMVFWVYWAGKTRPGVPE